MAAEDGKRSRQARRPRFVFLSKLREPQPEIVDKAVDSTAPPIAPAAAAIAAPTPYPAEGLDWLDGMGEGNIIEFGASLSGKCDLWVVSGEGKAESSYMKYLSFTGQIALEWGMRAEMDNKPALTAAWRAMP